MNKQTKDLIEKEISKVNNAEYIGEGFPVWTFNQIVGIIKSCLTNPEILSSEGLVKQKAEWQREWEVRLNELPENRPLYKDSGLWQIRTDDMETVLFQQEVNESFSDFITRAEKKTNITQ